MSLNGWIMVASALVAVAGYLQRNPLPPAGEILTPVRAEPAQSKVRMAARTVSYRDVVYEIEPLYEYDIAGVVVSYRYHDSENSRLHRLSQDHLNLLDLCVVWGDNAGNPALDKLDFWNGIFTCNVKTRDRAAWEAFDMDQLSNNHLISADPVIRDQLAGLKVGDQIRLRGYLSRYGPTGQPKRDTSTTRTDTGNGACETILIEQVEVLNATFSTWRMAMYAALMVLALTLIRHFTAPHRARGRG